MNSSASAGHSSLSDSTASEANKLKKAKLQAEAKYEQMLLDLKNLSTASEAFDWNNAEYHEIAKGMRSRVTWEEQHSEISKEVIEIKAQRHKAPRHNATAHGPPHPYPGHHTNNRSSGCQPGSLHG